MKKEIVSIGNFKSVCFFFTLAPQNLQISTGWVQLNNRLSNKIAVTVFLLITGDMLLISTKKTIKLSLWFSIHLQFADEFWGLILCSLVCASQSATATTHQKLSICSWKSKDHRPKANETFSHFYVKQILHSDAVQ